MDNYSLFPVCCTADIPPSVSILSVKSALILHPTDPTHPIDCTMCVPNSSPKVIDDFLIKAYLGHEQIDPEGFTRNLLIVTDMYGLFSHLYNNNRPSNPSVPRIGPKPSSFLDMAPTVVAMTL